MTPQEWTPNQLRVITGLFGRNADLSIRETQEPVSGAEVDRLRARLEDGLEPLGGRLVERLVVSKHQLSTVFKCEGLYQAPDEFAWSIPKCRGKVIHLALQTSVTGWGREAAPADLVEASIESLKSQDDSLAEFLLSCSSPDLAQLTSDCMGAVTTFEADFPPLSPRMRPRIEYGVWVDLLGRRVSLSGKYDLALGAPGRDPVTVIDLKTGRRYPEHMEEMRFYALLEALKFGAAPTRIATYYLDASDFTVEEVTIDSLESAVARTLDGAHKMSLLQYREREPSLTPGPFCKWCPLLAECSEGSSWLASLQNRRVEVG